MIKQIRLAIFIKIFRLILVFIPKEAKQTWLWVSKIPFEEM
jgi:hypothetical protein